MVQFNFKRGMSFCNFICATFVLALSRHCLVNCNDILVLRAGENPRSGVLC